MRDARLRVLVLGADALARSGLGAVLGVRDDLEVVAQLGLGAGVASQVIIHRPDAIVFDPGPLEGTAAFHDADPVPVLVLAADAEHAAAALAAGARGAIFRDGDGDRMAAALHAMDHGLRVIDAVFGSLGGALWGPGREPHGVELTPREAEVLDLLADGLSNKEIGARLGISDHTAKFHVNALLSKLDATTRTEAVTRAARLGLLQL